MAEEDYRLYKGTTLREECLLNVRFLFFFWTVRARTVVTKDVLVFKDPKKTQKNAHTGNTIRDF